MTKLQITIHDSAKFGLALGFHQDSQSIASKLETFSLLLETIHDFQRAKSNRRAQQLEPSIKHFAQSLNVNCVIDGRMVTLRTVFPGESTVSLEFPAIIVKE